MINLKEKLGPINWQFLPTKRFDVADFEAFLKLLPKTVDRHEVRHAVEVRHESFRTAEFPLVLLFGLQGEQIMRQPIVIALLPVPILIQVYFNAGLAYWLNRRLGVELVRGRR